MWQYLIELAFVRLKIQYKKSLLSIFWEPLTVFFVATILTLVWSQILYVENKVDYFCYVLVGFAIWNLLLSKLVSRACLSLCRRSAELVNQVKPVLSLPIEDIVFCYIGFFITLPFLLCVTIYFYSFNLTNFFFLLLGLILASVTALSLSLTLGVLAYFIRDFREVISAVMRLSFLITPVIWNTSRLGDYAHFIWWNPFYSYLDLCRSPLLGQEPHVKSVIVALGITITLSLMAVITFSLNYNNIRRKAFS